MFRRHLLFLLATLLAGAAVAGWAPKQTVCLGTVEECLEAGAGGEIDQLDSGLAGRRRMLELTGLISYGALLADRTPCSVPGVSYYNCRPGAAANPYSRGCSAITQCRS